MAKLSPDFSFTGSLGNLSAYRMRGIDKVILRTKGGASKDKIKKHPAFEKTRKINAEFGGRATASSYIMNVLYKHKALADYNIAGPLNALLKPIQELDTVSEYGKRNIMISQNPRLLEGFSLNRNNTFTTIVRNPLNYYISRETLSARIEIPELIPGINFYAPPGRHPMYSITASLGLIPDLYFKDGRYTPSTNLLFSKYESTEWYPTLTGSAAAILEFKPDGTPPAESFSLILSIGIRFGAIKDGGNIDQIPYAGAAKVLLMD